MPEVLKNVGNFLGSNAGKTVLGLGTAGAGLAQNLIAYRKQQDIQNTLTNPAKLSAMVAKETQPLSKGLTTDIARSADAYGAERGLGSSPYIMKDVYMQALAPYEYQQQQAALQAVLSQLGLAQRGAMQPVNVASIFKALQMAPGGGSNPNITSAGTIDPSVWAPMGGPMTLPTPSVDTGSFFAGDI